MADTAGSTVVIYAVVAGLVSVGALSALGSWDGEITDMVLTATDAARAFLSGQG